MLFGCLPFKPDSKTGDYSASILKLKFKIPKKVPAGHLKVSHEAGQLIKRLLVPHDQRATLEEIESHPWLKKTSFTPTNTEGQVSSDSESSDEEMAPAAEAVEETKGKEPK